MSGRGMTTAMKNAISGDSIVGGHLLEVILDSQTHYLTDLFNDVDWNGNTYIALGHFLQFDKIDETSDVRVNDVTVTLSGVDQSFISIFLQNDYVNRRARIYFAAWNGSSLVTDPVMLIDGLMDQPVIADNPETGLSTVAVRVSNQWADFDRITGRRTNHDLQQIYFPGDKGFEFASQQYRQLTWGRSVGQ